MGIGAAHFGASFIGCEHPIDTGAGGISLSLPCGDFVDEVLWIVDAPIQALATQDADLDLDHVALRREGHHVSAWDFLRLGVVVTLPALVLALGALSLTSPT